MEDPTYELGPLLAEIRDGYRGMRAIRRSHTAARREEARAARTALVRGLAVYTSPQELVDLDAILDRYSKQQTTHVRRIFAARRTTRPHRSHRFPPGLGPR
jgi:hypothetical protein